MNYSESIAEAMTSLDNQLEGIFKKSLLELQKQVVDGTPIDTGAARSNWFIEAEECSGTTTTDTEQKNLAEAENLLAGENMASVYYLYNNLPYIPTLEYGLYPNPPKNPTGKTLNGYSTQAPQGFFRTAVAGWQQIVEDAAKETE